MNRRGSLPGTPCASQRLKYGLLKVFVFLKGGQLRMIRPDLLGGAEQEAGLGGLDHAQVVIAVTHRDRFKADGLKRLHRGELGLAAAHPEVDDPAALVRLQGIAEDSGHPQLFHQRVGKLGERVAEYDDLGFIPELGKSCLINISVFRITLQFLH